MSTVIVVAYSVVLSLLCVYGLHRSQLVWLFLRNRGRKTPAPTPLKELPLVTIQLPMFNEQYVASRLIDSMAMIDYPKDKLEIQVLDDSTDTTQQIARARVDALREQGLDAVYLHRDDRTGFKAGALDAGLKVCKGEFVLVFDADFLPPPGILHQLVHYFSNPKTGMVQARWGHINRDYSLLTRVQSMMLDGHFVIEHLARLRSGRFFNFNGTAGIWRKAAIIDAGGWQHDTLTEDMDLSYRAQLRGWQFAYLPDVVSPAEVPVEINSFKSQQFRWAKGSIQVAKKMLPVVLKADLPLKVKLEAFFHLTNNVAYLLLVLLSILLLPNILARTDHSMSQVLLLDFPLFAGTTCSVAIFYIVSHHALYGNTWEGIRRLPLLMSLGIGLSINNARAVLEGLIGHETDFIRTPKMGVETTGDKTWKKRRYRVAKNFMPALELLFALYFAIAIYIAASRGHWGSLPFLVLFLAGYVYVGTLSVLHARHT
ncbi:MAG: glycosyltransferase [Deltaproteobacteria bacterium]|nr:glycosyltransferase [Deltaproteobacteria bacterium]